MRILLQHTLKLIFSVGICEPLTSQNRIMDLVLQFSQFYVFKDIHDENVLPNFH